MTNGQMGGLVGFSLMLAAGQVLFKVAALASRWPGGTGLRLPALLLEPSFWIALLLYGTATLLWIYLLQSVPLSRAYPFAALGFLFVPLMAMTIFGEKLSAAYGAGVTLIVAGILVTTFA